MSLSDDADFDEPVRAAVAVAQDAALRGAIEARLARGVASDRSPSPGTSERDHLAQALASLTCDWAYVVHLGTGGEIELAWVGGRQAKEVEVAGVEMARGVWERFVCEADRPTMRAHLLETLREGQGSAEFRLVLPGRGERWTSSSMYCEVDPTVPDRIRLFGATVDTTDQRAMRAALDRRDGEYRALVEQASDGILVCDEAGRILMSNGAAQGLFGASVDALHARCAWDLFGGESEDTPSPEDAGLLTKLARGETLRSVRPLSRIGSGEPIWAEVSARRLDDGRVQLTIRDVSARWEAEQRIRHLAYYDSLTSLPNRGLFREQVEGAVDRARRVDCILALLFLDVDRFKQVNDSLGHAVGDELLVQVADRLRSAIRGSDSVGRSSQPADAPPTETAISRLGGDEFTILLQDLEHAQDAARVARRVLHQLSRPFLIQEREVFVGASVGVAIWPEDGTDGESLIRSADTAMYHAKGRGGNCYEFFDPGMNESASKRLELEAGLRHALERDQLVLHYQPIRDTETGRVSAVEALVRWVNDAGEMVRPDHFIPVAEETGVIVPIGEWILRTACRQAMAWRAEGLEPVRISVNVSVEQLRDLGIVNAVEQVLQETGLPVTDLELEITETSILDESPNIVATIGALTDLGIGFALDDFGTGYSSLSALQRFPIDRLKIDRSFVAGIGERESDEALASAVVALAKRLGLGVVAEGVETEHQSRVLTSLGCEELQGFLFSKPVEGAALAALLAPAPKPARTDDIAGPEGAR